MGRAHVGRDVAAAHGVAAILMLGWHLVEEREVGLAQGTLGTGLSLERCQRVAWANAFQRDQMSQRAGAPKESRRVFFGPNIPAHCVGGQSDERHLVR